MWCGKILPKSSPHVRESRLWNPGNFCLWSLELTRILLVESGIQNTAQGVQNPTNDWNPVPVTKTGVQYPESGIHGVESGNQDYRGFPYTERKSYNIDEKRPKPQYPIIHCIVLCITTSYHSSRFILYMQGAFCALNRLLLFLKQKLSPLCDCRDLHKDQTTLLLYLLLHRNPNVATFILSRTDIDNLVSVFFNCFSNRTLLTDKPVCVIWKNLHGVWYVKNNNSCFLVARVRGRNQASCRPTRVYGTSDALVLLVA